MEVLLCPLSVSGQWRRRQSQGIGLTASRRYAPIGRRNGAGSLAFLQLHLSVNRPARERLLAPIGPDDLDALDTLRRPEPKRRPHVARAQVAGGRVDLSYP